MAGSAARKIEAQGRLFWVWVLTLPILLLHGAAEAFGAPWPNPLTQKIAMVMLAFPVLFVVGEPLLVTAREALAARRLSVDVVVAAAALGCYLSGLVAFVLPAPPLAGFSALVVSTYLSARYATTRY